MAITIQTERELRKYLFESFLNEQHQKKLLREQEENPEDDMSDISTEPTDEEKSISAARKKALEVLNNSDENNSFASNAKGFWNAIWSDTPIIYPDYPVTLNTDIMKELQAAKEMAFKENNYNKLYNMPAQSQELIRINLMFKLHTQPFTLTPDDDGRTFLPKGEGIFPKDYDKINKYNRTSLTKLYSNGESIYLGIPLDIFKDKLKNFSMSPQYASIDITEVVAKQISFGEIALKTYQTNGDSFKFENAILEDDIYDNLKQEKNWQYLSLRNTLYSIRNNPIFNFDITVPKWDEKASREKFKNTNDHYKPANDKYKLALKTAKIKYGPKAPVLESWFQDKYPNDPHLQIIKAGRPKFHALNSFQEQEKAFYNNLDTNIYKGRCMMFYGVNPDEGYSWSPVGIAENATAIFEWILQQLMNSQYLKSFDMRCMILCNELQKNYFKQASDMLMKQFEVITNQNAPLYAQAQSGNQANTTSDASGNTWQSYITQLADSDIPDGNFEDSIKEYLGDTYSEFELSRFIELIQLKRTSQALSGKLVSGGDNKIYNAAYTINPEFDNPDNPRHTALKQYLGGPNPLGIDKRNLTEEEYNKLVTSDPGYATFFIPVYWSDSSKDGDDVSFGMPSIDTDAENLTDVIKFKPSMDFSDKLVAWNTGKSFVTPLLTSDVKDLAASKDQHNELSKKLTAETLNFVGVQSALDAAQIAMIPGTFAGDPVQILASAGISFASWWNRGGYINFIEAKISEIEQALTEATKGDMSAANRIINDLKKFNIVIGNIENQNEKITPEQKIEILNILLSKLHTTEIMEQIIWNFDMIGWIPVAVTASKAYWLQKYATAARLDARTAQTASHVIHNTKPNGWMNKTTGEIYQSADDAKKASSYKEGDEIVEHFPMENVHIDPNDFHFITNFIPDFANKWKMHIKAAIESVIEKAYNKLFVPLRTMGEDLYTVTADISKTLNDGEEISEDLYNLIVAKNPDLNSKFTHNSTKKTYTFNDPAASQTQPPSYKIFSKGENFQGDKVKDTLTKSNILTKETESEFLYQNLSLNKFIDILKSIEALGAKGGRPIYENLLDLARALIKQGKSLKECFELYCRIYGISADLLPKVDIVFDALEQLRSFKNTNLIDTLNTALGKNITSLKELLAAFEELKDILKSMEPDKLIDLLNNNPGLCKLLNFNANNPAVSKLQEFLKLRGSNFIINNYEDFIKALSELKKIKPDVAQVLFKQNSPSLLKDFAELNQFNELSRYLKLFNTTDDLDNIDNILNTTKNFNKADDLYIVYAQRLENNFHVADRAMTLKIPLQADYASTIEIIDDIKNAKGEILYKAGHKLSQQEYDNLIKKKIITDDKVQQSAPKIKGGVKQYEADMKEFAENFNRVRQSELDYIYAFALTQELGNTRYFNEVIGNETKSIFTNLQKINDLMESGHIDITEKTLVSVFAGLQTWFANYEKFLNYLLLAKYVKNNDFNVFNVYDDFISSGTIPVNLNYTEATGFEALKKQFEDLRERLKGMFNSSTFKVGNTDDLAGKSIKLDKFDDVLNNKPIVSQTELGYLRKLFQDINTNYPTSLANFKDSLNEWNAVIEKLENEIATAISKLQNNNEPAKLKALLDLQSRIARIKRVFADAHSEIATSTLFHARSYNFKKLDKLTDLLHNVFHITSKKSGVLTGIRQWLISFEHIFKDELALHVTRAAVKGSEPFYVLSQIARKIAQILNKARGVLSKESLETAVKEIAQVSTEVEKKDKSGLGTVALKYLRLTLILLLKHPVFSVTLATGAYIAYKSDAYQTFLELKGNIDYLKMVAYPVIYALLARLASGVILSGNASLEKQFMNLYKASVQPHFLLMIKSVDNVNRNYQKFHALEQSYHKKRDFQENLEKFATDNKPDISPEEVDEIISGFQDNHIILKNHTSEAMKDFINDYSAVLNGMSPDKMQLNANASNQENVKIELKFDEDQDNIAYIIKNDDEETQVYLPEVITDDKKTQNMTSKRQELSINYPGLTIYDISPEEVDGVKTFKRKVDYEQIITNYKNKKQFKQYSLNLEKYRLLPSDDKAKFKEGLINAINSQADLNDTVSKNTFIDTIWTRQENESGYSEESVGLLTQYNFTINNLRDTFYYFVGDTDNIKTSPTNIGLYWKQIITAHKNSRKIMSNIVDKLTFLDFYNTLTLSKCHMTQNKNAKDMSEIDTGFLKKVIGYIKNYKLTATDIKGATNPFINFDNRSSPPITYDDNSLKLWIQENIIKSLDGEKLKKELGENQIFKDAIDVITDVAAASENKKNAFVNILLPFMQRYYRLYYSFLKTIQQYDIQSEYKNDVRIKNFVIFLEGIALIKKCMNIQQTFKSYNHSLGLSDLDDDKKIKHIEKKIGNQTFKRRVIKDHRFDIRAMLTHGINSINYDTTTNKNAVDISKTDITLNPIFLQMKEGREYLDAILKGKEPDSLTSLFDENANTLIFSKEGQQSFEFTAGTSEMMPLPSNIVREITDVSNIIKGVRDSFDEVVNLNNMRDIAKEAQQIEKTKTNESRIKIFKNKGQKLLFEIEEPLVATQVNSNNTGTNKNINIAANREVGDININLVKKLADNQKKFKQAMENQNSEYLKKYLKTRGLKNEYISSIEASRDVFAVINSYQDDINFKLFDVIKNTQKIDEMKTNINTILGLYEKYNFIDDVISKNFVTILKKYENSLPVVVENLKKCGESINKINNANIAQKKNDEFLTVLNKNLSKGIVQFSAEEKHKVILRRDLSKVIKINTKLTGDSMKSFINSNDRNSNSAYVIKNKLNRVLYIISKLFVPMLKKIDNLSVNGQEINLDDLIVNYTKNILSLYKNSIDDQKIEGVEYAKFMQETVKKSIDTNTILEDSYIVGYKLDKKTKNIFKLIILADLSNLKIEKENATEFTNDFMFDIPFLYEINLTEIFKNETQQVNNNDTETVQPTISFTQQDLTRENVKISLIENEKNSAILPNNNSIDFNIYKINPNNKTLIQVLLDKKIIKDNYKINRIINNFGM